MCLITINIYRSYRHYSCLLFIFQDKKMHSQIEANMNGHLSKPIDVLNQVFANK